MSCPKLFAFKEAPEWLLRVVTQTPNLGLSWSVKTYHNFALIIIIYLFFQIPQGIPHATRFPRVCPDGE